jgi:hypothetical protein
MDYAYGHSSLIKPSVIREGREFWYYKGKSHRLDGPADMYHNYMNFTDDYFIHGVRATDEKQFRNKAWRRQVLLLYLGGKPRCL